MIKTGFIEMRGQGVDIKLIALDLDGTLLDSSKRLSERNYKALVRCMEKGIEIVPTTGRTVDGIPEILKSIPGIRYAITTNGASIKNLLTKEELDSRKMPSNLAHYIMEKAVPYHIMYDAYIEGRGISEDKFYYHLDEYNIPEANHKMIHDTRDVVPCILEYVMECGKEIEKVNMFFREEETRVMMRKILSEIPGILVTSSLPNNLEINSLEAAKGEAILRLSHMLGIRPDQTMAFGDGENDFDMIEKVGFGVVMANGIEGLKIKADYITSTNDEDGVAAAIEKLVL